MAGIRQEQIRDGALEFTGIPVYEAVSTDWEDDATLNSIRDQISHYWYLNESGSTFSPIIGTSDMLAIGGSVGVSTSRVSSPLNESAIWLAQSTSYYLISDSAVGPSADFTLWGWFKMESINSPYENIFDWDYSASSERRGVYQQSAKITQQRTLTTAIDFANPASGLISTFNYSNAWSLYIQTIEGTDVSLYINGNLVGTATVSSSIDMSSSKLVLGRRWNNPINGPKGGYCHFGIMDGYVVSPEEAGLMWNRGYGRFPTV